MILFPGNFTREIAELQRAGKLPSGMSARQVSLLQKSLSRFSGEVSDRLLGKILGDFKSKMATAASMEDPERFRSVLADLQGFVGSEEVADRIKFSLNVAQQVTSGAGQYLNQNLSPEAVDEYPALEFKRLFDRNVPRGERIGAKGAIVEVPDENWPTRWAAAGEEAGDDAWLPWDGDDQTGRGVALKSSGIWQALGDGAGGYTDTLGNPFPPFAFNSGFMTLDVSRAEAVLLGLIGKNEEAEPAEIDYGKLLDIDED